MAYDRFDTRSERERRYRDHDRDRRDEDRGFFERAGDEIASWFGDDEAERRRRQDERMNREDYNRGSERDHGRYNRGGDYDHGRYAYSSTERDQDRDRSRGFERDFGRRRSNDEGRSQRGYGGYDRDFAPSGWGARNIERGYSPGYSGGTGYTGGYGGYGYGSGNERGYGSGGYGGAFTGSDYERRDNDRSEGLRAGSGGSMRDSDRHYQSWRQRQLDELDRDYDQYNRERQERFESDFGAWRESRMSKRQQLGRIREHMEVVGSDGDTVGKVDCVRDDRIILTKSDSPDDRHHSIDCSMIDTVEGDQVRLDISADEAKNRWRDEDRGGLFGRGRDRDRDEHVNLERSFSGTYS
jgi:hypothetical protein